MKGHATIAHDPKVLPIARNCKFTENGQRLVLPDAHWKIMAAKGRYRLFVTDPDAGQVACFATIREEGNTPEGTGVVQRGAGRNRREIDLWFGFQRVSTLTGDARRIPAIS